MKRCAFLTMEDLSEFFVYDALTYPALQALGWTIDEVAWTNRDVNWSDYDAVVIRSTWDYQAAPERFMKTLTEIERSKTQLFNPLSICEWNMVKTYLRDLESRGVRTIPSVWLDKLDVGALTSVFEHFQNERIILKPQVGANADDAFVLTSEGPPNDHANALGVFSNKPLIAQPFLNSICRTGEWSLFYFGNHYSHAVIKRPAEGDFRVQEEHGGQISSEIPTAELLELGQTTIRALGESLLYARVDIVHLDDGQPAVIEVELIEPSLYFEFDTESPGRFAHVLNRMATES